MKRTIFAAIALVTAAPAIAGPPPPHTTVWNPQSTTLPGYTAATVIQDFETTPHHPNANYVPETLPGVFQESVNIQQDKRVAYFDAPLSGMDGQYIGIVNGADYIIELLGGGAQFFSFAFNGLNTNDKVTLYFSDGTSQTIIGHDVLTGGDVIGVPNKDIPDPPNDWGRVSYDMNAGPSIVKVAFTSAGNSTWYIDSIAFAAPEAATWAMLIVGFGLAGWQLRIRRRKTKLATA